MIGGLFRLQQRDFNDLAHPQIETQDLVSSLRRGIDKRDGPQEKALINAAEFAQERVLAAATGQRKIWTLLKPSSGI
jgi:hypothetical protein